MEKGGQPPQIKKKWGKEKTRGSKKASFLEWEKWELFLKSWCHFQIRYGLKGIKKKQKKKRKRIPSPINGGFWEIKLEGQSEKS